MPGKPGRPRKVKPLAADVDPEKVSRNFSAIRSANTIKLIDFEGRIGEYPKEHLTQFYVYRLWPIIRRQQGGEKFNYVAKWDEFSVNRLAAEHKAGEYHVRWKNITTGIEIANVFVTVSRDPERWEETAPAVNPEEVADVPENKEFIAELKRSGKWGRNPAAASEESKEMSSAIETLTNTVTKLAQDKPAAAPAPDPAKQLTGLVEAIKALQPPAAPQITLNDLLAFADRMKPAAPPPATQSGIEQLQASAELLRSFGWAPANGAAAANPDEDNSGALGKMARIDRKSVV